MKCPHCGRNVALCKLDGSRKRFASEVGTSLLQGQTAHRLTQAAFSGLIFYVVAVALEADGHAANTLSLICFGGVWFISLVGREVWEIALKLTEINLDYNQDGQLDTRDITAALKDGLQANTPPDLPVEVIRGNVTVRSRISGTTPEQWHEAASIMSSVTNHGKPFARRRVGHVFGENFSHVQEEMLRLGLLEGSPRAGYALTDEGKDFLNRYAPSPSLPEVA